MFSSISLTRGVFTTIVTRYIRGERTYRYVCYIYSGIVYMRITETGLPAFAALKAANVINSRSVVIALYCRERPLMIVLIVAEVLPYIAIPERRNFADVGGADALLELVCQHAENSRVEGGCRGLRPATAMLRGLELEVRLANYGAHFDLPLSTMINR